MNRKRHVSNDDADDTKLIRKGFVYAGGGYVHFRTAGEGPAVVLLHDSPRSSRLHVETIKALAHRYTVFALDTPGYGMSGALPFADPSVRDFADALEVTLEAMGLTHAPIYATHTSAKIALEYAALTGKPPRLILDGLSIPDSLAPASFVDAYMRPFRVEATGAYLAAEWQRIRDMLRWFPWFEPAPANRMAMDRPDACWIEQYTIDLFSAEEHYSDAYGAAMRYDPAAALRSVNVPTLVAARSNDVLYGFLDKVPVDHNTALTVERLGADKAIWLEWLEESLNVKTAVMSAPRLNTAGSNVLQYVDVDNGQMLIRQTGRSSDAPPLIILEVPAPLSAIEWQKVLANQRNCVIPELPGFGESDPLGANADMAGLVRALQAAIAKLGGIVDVLAIGNADVIALALASSLGSVRRIVFDGAPDKNITRSKLCPRFPFSTSGAHIHEIFHMLRDGQVQYPWFEGSADARRLTDPMLDPRTMHEALTGILKQTENYGDALNIAVSAELNSDAIELHKVESMVFTCPEDPFYVQTDRLATSLPSCILKPRPASFAEAAASVEHFLSDGK